MRKVRLLGWTAIGALLGAAMAALILIAVGLECPPSIAGFGELVGAVIILFFALYLGFTPARHLHEKGIPQSLERYAGTWCGCELFCAGFACLLFAYHHTWLGVAIAAFYLIAVVVFFADSYRKPVLPPGGKFVRLEVAQRKGD